MQTVTDISIFDGNYIAEHSLWNMGEQRDLLLHRIHAYPAKFPPFLIQKIIEYFESLNKEINLVADPFCGCGTSALEATKLGKDFWGCDINPVATLIAKTKSNAYAVDRLIYLHKEITARINRTSSSGVNLYQEHERIKYWFTPNRIRKLFQIRKSIEEIVPQGKYRDFFLTGFSNILKPSSRWLTKSIKPQIDPNKLTINPMFAFEKQIKMMIKAVEEANDSINFSSQVKILNKNFLKIETNKEFVDTVITSPPYVTSYEYADLHQLSSLWLDYTDDYRKLRRGSIGSNHHTNNIDELYQQVNQTAKTIYDKLRKQDSTKAKSVLRYFYDLEAATEKVKKILKVNGSAAFVIGNTNYKGVTVNNAKVLAQNLIDSDFRNIRVSKRKISNKILTPYRDKEGRFTSNADGKKVYSHEYILMCEK